MIGNNPSQIPDVLPAIEDSIWPDEDYTGDDIDYTEKVRPPRVWIDANPVREIPADRTTTQTIIVPQYTAVTAPAQIIPRAGNNQRKNVIVRNNSGQTVWLIGGDAQAPSPIVVTIGAVNVISNAFALVNGAEYVHESAAPMWAAHAEASATLELPVSVITNSYLDSDR